MTTQQSLAQEWQTFQNQRRELLANIEKLRRTLRSLPEEASMQQLFRERDEIKKKIQFNEEMTIGFECLLASRDGAIQELRNMPSDTKKQNHLKLCMRLDCYALYNNLPPDSPPEKKAVMETLKETVANQLHLPIDEMEIRFKRDNEQTRLELAQVTKELQQYRERIENINAHYEISKKLLENAVARAEKEKTELREKEVEWASQDVAHAEWISEHSPQYRDDVVRRFKVRFPGSSFGQPASLIPSHAPRLSKERRQKNSLPADAKPETPQKAWQFWVTFNHHESGIPLPGEKEGFTEKLHEALRAVNYQNIDAEIIHRKILNVTRMTIQQRQQFNKLSGVEPEGWKIMKVSKFRIFLSIDEVSRTIRFLPEHRKKAFSPKK